MVLPGRKGRPTPLAQQTFAGKRGRGSRKGGREGPPGWAVLAAKWRTSILTLAYK